MTRSLASNRRALTDRLGRLVARHKRNGTLIALLFLDLDEFKRVNDQHGHGAGDEVLCQKSRADCWPSPARPTSCHALAATSLVLTETDVTLQSHERARPAHPALKLGTSVQLWWWSRQSRRIDRRCTVPRASDARELIQWADAAMYEAKRPGKGRYVRRPSPTNGPEHMRFVYAARVKWQCLQQEGLALANWSPRSVSWPSADRPSPRRKHAPRERPATQAAHCPRRPDFRPATMRRAQTIPLTHRRRQNAGKHARSDCRAVDDNPLLRPTCRSGVYIRELVEKQQIGNHQERPAMTPPEHARSIARSSRSQCQLLSAYPVLAPVQNRQATGRTYHQML